MHETTTLIELLEKKERLVAMVAPSFPIIFPYPEIVTMLRTLGFTYVVEVSAGAQKTNEQLLTLYKADPHARYITSPCPTIVRMIKKQMPQYAKYLTHGVDSPMIATAKIVRETYPGYRPVFIGPCVMKKFEASEDHPELNILVITYAELSEVIAHFHIPKETNPRDHFDIAAQGATRTYAIDGGLTQSSGATRALHDAQIGIVSGAQNTRKAIEEFDRNTDIKLLDILNCPGGCISGPGIRSTLTTEERRKKILRYVTSL